MAEGRSAYSSRTITQLESLFVICSHRRMERIDQSTIAATILHAPGWARVGITAPNETLRDAAAHELARTIIERIGGMTGDAVSPDQLALML